MVIFGFNASDLASVEDIEIKGHNSGDIESSGRVIIRHHNAGNIQAKDILIHQHNSGHISAPKIKIHQHNSGEITCTTADVGGHNSGKIDSTGAVDIDGHNSGEIRAEEIVYQGWKITRSLLVNMKQKTLNNNGLVLSKGYDHWDIEDRQGNVSRIEIKENRIHMYHIRSGRNINVNGTSISMSGSGTIIITGNNGTITFSS